MKLFLSNTVSLERFNCIPDLGVGYLLSIARNAGHEVRFLDCLREHITYDQFAEAVRAFQPRVAGVKVYSGDLGPAREMLARIKALSPDILTVIGGPHPSTELPELLFEQFPELDFAFAGEAEPGFSRFLEKIESGATDFSDVQGLVWKDASGGVHANEKAFVAELDALPFPAWDLMDPRGYPWGYSFMTYKYPAAPMVLTRGCPFNCTFCGSHLITGRSVRKRGIDNIIEEIRMLQREYGVKSIDICDENFVYDNAYATEFCERMIRENLGVEWNCPYGVRLDKLNENLVRLMERAGCYGFSVGVESGSDRILHAIKKCLSVEEVREQMRMIKRASRIMVQGYFIIGFPTETKEEIEATIGLACSLPFDIAAFHPLRVTPGTEIYQNLVAAGFLQKRMDYGGLGNHYFVRSYCPVSDEEMRALYRKAYLRFYGRPKVIWNLLRHTRSKAQWRTILNGVGRLLAKPVAMFDPRKKRSASSAN